MRRILPALLLLAACGDGRPASPPAAGDPPPGTGTFACDAPEVIDFGRVFGRQPVTRSFRCENGTSSEARLLLEPFTGPGAAFFTEDVFLEEVALPPGAAETFVIAFQAPGEVLGVTHALLDWRLEDGTSAVSTRLEAEVIGCDEVGGLDPLPQVGPDGLHRPYDLGFVEPGSSSELRLTILNRADEPLEVREFALDPVSSPWLSLTPASPYVVAPRSSAIAVLRFAPLGVGEATGQINLVSSSPCGPVRSYKVLGFGGREPR